MSATIASITYLVRDYDEAIAFFTQCLRFTLLEDTEQSESKRWVRVAPANQNGVALLLAKAVNDEQTGQIGHQAGGRVFLFLHTDDFWGDYKHMQAHGVQFTEQVREELYGTVVVFEDLYGNKWDLIQHKTQ